MVKVALNSGNVRNWHKAEVSGLCRLRLLSGGKRKSEAQCSLFNGFSPLCPQEQTFMQRCETGC